VEESEITWTKNGRNMKLQRCNLCRFCWRDERMDQKWKNLKLQGH